MPQSFRVGGVTALFAAGMTAEEIKTMGRWFSDVYRIYCRLSKERLLRLSHRMSNSRSTQFLNGVDGFFGTVAPAGELDLEEVEQQEPGQPPEADRDEDGGGDDGLGPGSDAESDDGSGMTDAEFLTALQRPAARPSAASGTTTTQLLPLEDLSSVGDDDDEMAL